MCIIVKENKMRRLKGMVEVEKNISGVQVCSNCGEINYDGVNFCQACGSMLKNFYKF